MIPDRATIDLRPTFLHVTPGVVYFYQYLALFSAVSDSGTLFYATRRVFPRETCSEKCCEVFALDRPASFPECGRAFLRRFPEDRRIFCRIIRGITRRVIMNRDAGAPLWLQKWGRHVDLNSASTAPVASNRWLNLLLISSETAGKSRVKTKGLTPVSRPMNPLAERWRISTIKRIMA